jgi:hypothetical protein
MQHRYDTPFRILAKRLQATPNVSYDYNIDPQTGQMIPLNSSDSGMLRVGVLRDSLTGPSTEPTFLDSGTVTTSKAAGVDAVSCDMPSDSETRAACRQIWDGGKYVRAEVRQGLTREPLEEWTELYRGLPLRAYAGQPGQGRIRPVMSPALMQSMELRIEACGQDGRVFGSASPNFFESLKDVRVTGTRTRRPKGLVTDAQRRLVYVPKPNFHGSDGLTFVLRDLSGGSNRSDSRFSQAQSWSPPAVVTITVTPIPDKPLATHSIISFPPADGVITMLIPVKGKQPGNAASQTPTAFDVHIDSFPQSGVLLKYDLTPAESVVRSDTTGYVRYRPPANACGVKYAALSYRVRNSAEVNGLFSARYTATVDIRCAAGATCDEKARKCVPCPAGTYGNTSGISQLCKLCGVGEYQPATGQKQCVKCPAGTYTSQLGARACRKCAPGTANPQEGAMYCPDCPAGYHAPLAAATKCEPCGALAHTAGPGSYTCRDCPMNTRGIVDASPNLQHCQCIFGSYDIKGRKGAPCHACPPGAYCHGRTLLPVPRTGYWTSQEFWSEDVANSNNGTQTVLSQRGQAYFAPCSYRYIRGVCLGYPDVDVQEREERCMYRNSEVLQGPRRLDIMTSEGIGINITECTVHSPSDKHNLSLLRPYSQRQNYSANFYCAEGYAGVICSTCAPNWRRALEGNCEQCGDIYSIPWVSAGAFLCTVGIAIIFWSAMFFTIAFPARSLYIVATHVQLLGVLGKLAVPWPRYTQNMLNGFDMLNICLDSIHWNCVGFDLEPYWQRWAGELVISPVILILIHLYHVWAGMRMHYTYTDFFMCVCACYNGLDSCLPHQCRYAYSVHTHTHTHTQTFSYMYMNVIR